MQGIRYRARGSPVPAGSVTHFTSPALSFCMGAFICDRCGKCCVSLGQHIIIERQLNERDYYCRSKIDNTRFPVSVDPAFREEIADEVAAGDTPGTGRETKPCRFLRKDPSGEGSCCAIYASRPAVCRNFRCYHTVIRNREGTVCGKVAGKNSLRTGDPVLAGVWDSSMGAIPSSDAAGWRQRVAAILAEHGYTAEPAE